MSAFNCSISTKVHDLKVLPLGKANINLAQGTLSMVHGVTRVTYISNNSSQCFHRFSFKGAINNLVRPMYIKRAKRYLYIHPPSTETNTTPYSASLTNCMMRIHVPIHVPILQVLTLEVLYSVTIHNL
jgi:hypothetical protein